MHPYLLRGLLFIPGFFKAVFHATSCHARDLALRMRFPHVRLDANCCATPDSEIGEGCHLYSGCLINHSRIGRYTTIARNTLIQHSDVGHYCSIANDVQCGVARHDLSGKSTASIFSKRENSLRIPLVECDSPFEEYLPLHIGNDVWIGTRAIVMGGLTIGDGAVIAAGAVVTRDVPPYAIVAGIPARILSYRPAQAQADVLRASHWWDYAPAEAWQILQSLD